MRKRLIIIAAFFVLSLSMVSSGTANETQVIAGAGPSTVVVQLFAKTIKVDGYSFEVPPKSAKHAGGIKNSGEYLFGRTGRPLNDKEKAMNKAEIFLARIPIAFAVGPDTEVSSLTIEQIEKLFTGGAATWKDVGGADEPVATIGREATEALFSVLKKEYPFFNNAKFGSVVKKDHQVVGLLRSPQGANAIGFGAKPNFDKAMIETVPVDGFLVGVSVGLVYDLKNSDHPLIKAAKELAASDAWAKKVTASGLLPPQ